MNFSEKLIALRKGRGWSQEDLAEQLDISRQSVSKWESSASLPDLDKIIHLSDIFGVTTDYLLRDEQLPESAPVIKDEQPALRRMDDDEVFTYLALVENEAPRFAFATMLCVLSPIPLIATSALSEMLPAVNVEPLMFITLAILLLMVAFAVRMFIAGGIKLSPYDYLEQEPLHISAAAKLETQARQAAQQEDFTSGVVRGVTLCIISAVPLLLVAGFGLSGSTVIFTVCLLLALVAIAVRIFVRVGLVRESYSKILQTGDYTTEAKKHAPIASIYWCGVTAVYLAVSFITVAWHRTWIIWPVAGVLFGCVAAAQQMFSKRR